MRTINSSDANCVASLDLPAKAGDLAGVLAANPRRVQLNLLRDLSDILFIGDMRMLKGVDVLLDAIASLNASRPTTACLVGDGPDLPQFKAQAKKLGLDGLVSFPGRMGAREAFGLGRILVMPSRAESFPYVVLEACAAGVPLIASNVGGIPEVLGPGNLVPPGDAAALASRLAEALADPQAVAASAADTRERLRTSFSAPGMVDSILGSLCPPDIGAAPLSVQAVYHSFTVTSQ